MNKLLRSLPIFAILILVVGLLGWQRLQAYLVDNPTSPIASLDERLIDRQVLANGLAVYLVSDPGAPIASWQWQGPAARGVNALGQRAYSATNVEQYVTSLGGHWQAFSGMQETQVSASGQDLTALMDLLASLAADPVADHPQDWRGAAIRNQRVFVSEGALVISSRESLAAMARLIPASLASLPSSQPNGRAELGLTRSTPNIDTQARLSIPVAGIARQPIEQALQTLARFSPAPEQWHIEADWLHFDYASSDELDEGIRWYYTLAEQWGDFARFQNVLGCYSPLSERLLRLGDSGAQQSCFTGDSNTNFSSNGIAIALRAWVAEDRVTSSQRFGSIDALAKIWPSNPLPLVEQSFEQDDVIESALFRQQLSLVHQSDTWQQWHRQSKAPVSQLFVSWQLNQEDLTSAQLLAAAINSPMALNKQLGQRHVLASAQLVNAQLQVQFTGPPQELPGAVTSWLLWLAEVGDYYNAAQSQLALTPRRFLQQQVSLDGAEALNKETWLASLQGWLFSREMMAMHDGPLDSGKVSAMMQSMREQLPGEVQPQGNLTWQLNQPNFLLTDGSDQFQLYLPRQSYSEAAQQRMVEHWLAPALRDYGREQSPQLTTDVQQSQDVLIIRIAADTDPGLLELHWRRFVGRLAQSVKDINPEQFDAWRMGLADSVAWLPESPVQLAQQDWQAVSRGYVHLDERLRHKSAITQMSQDRFVRWLEGLAESDQSALWHHQYSRQFGSYDRSEFARDRLTITDPFSLLKWDEAAKLSPSLLVRN